MNLPQPLTVSRIAAMIDAEVIGDESLEIKGVNEIHKVRPGDLTFADVEKYFSKAIHSAATAIILNKPAECPDGKALLICEHPFQAYDSMIQRYRPYRPAQIMIDPGAEIHPAARIEPNVMIGPHVRIGAHTTIESGVVIREYCTIGERVMIQAGVKIGTDAFYFKKTPEGHIQWTTGGSVRIEDDVYVGANTTINKGVSGETVIGEGTKIDCLVHIGHGVVIGKQCIIAGQVGISGKAVIGDHCVIYGQAGIAPGVTIGDHTLIHPQSGVSGDLAGNKSYFGSPAVEARHKWRQIAAVKQLPDILRILQKQSD